MWDLTVRDLDKACVQSISDHDGTVLGLGDLDQHRLLVSCSTDKKVKATSLALFLR